MGKMGLWGVLYVTLVVRSMMHLLISLQEGETPLMRASSGGHITCVQLLLEKGAHVNHQANVSAV